MDDDKENEQELTVNFEPDENLMGENTDFNSVYDITLSNGTRFIGILDENDLPKEDDNKTYDIAFMYPIKILEYTEFDSSLSNSRTEFGFVKYNPLSDDEFVIVNPYTISTSNKISPSVVQGYLNSVENIYFGKEETFSKTKSKKKSKKQSKKNKENGNVICFKTWKDKLKT